MTISNQSHILPRDSGLIVERYVMRKEIPRIIYPESDGKPMAETDAHRRLINNLIFELENYYRSESDVYVSGNLLLYYAEGDPTKRVAPDVFVARGVSRGDRRVYKLWEEGRPPDVVFELSSRQTWREDLQTKWKLYEQLGVKEYFIFDPEYDYLSEPLVGYRLVEGQYQSLEIENGRILSQSLGLYLVDTGETLRLLDAQTEKFLPTTDESAQEVARLLEEIERMKQGSA